MRSIFLCAVMAILAGCAGQRAPDGGPIDTDPPVVIATTPPNYTTHFSGESITLEFSEYVDHRTVENALFISPSLGALAFDWSGREVEIRFSERLRRNTTYVVTIGTDVADINNRNKMAQAHTLAFTTGDDIDHGAIEGRIYPRQATDSPQGVTVLAYQLRDIKADTLDPRNTRPDYVTQTGKNGEFFLKHLAFGSYRVVALRDEYKNLLYDPEIDDCGIASGDIRLTPEDTLRSNVWMKLVREDTTSLRLLKAASRNQHAVLADFSSPVDTRSLSRSWFRITDTATHRSLKILTAVPVYPKATSILLSTEDQVPEAPYRLETDSLRSEAGFGLNPLARSLVFLGSNVPDTLGPVVSSCSVGDSSRGIELDPSISIHFSTPVQRSTAEQAIVLVDSGRVPVSLRYLWFSDASVQLRAAERLKSRVWHSLRLGLKQISDFFGKTGRDSLRILRFQTIDQELFSTIDGTVRDGGSFDMVGPVYVVVRNAAAKDTKEYVSRLDQPGPFTLKDIPEGKYILHAYRDRNGNGRYDAGRVFPHKASERFTQYADTLKVRARWPLEGVTMWLR